MMKNFHVRQWVKFQTIVQQQIIIIIIISACLSIHRNFKCHEFSIFWNKSLTWNSFAIDNTRSNKVKIVKTPGGKLRYLHLKKAGTRPKCGDCGIALPGLAALRPRQYASATKTQKTVNRAYGGSLCSNCVKEKIVRAFLVEEQKIVKKVLQQKDAAEKKSKTKKSRK